MGYKDAHNLVYWEYVFYVPCSCACRKQGDRAYPYSVQRGAVGNLSTPNNWSIHNVNFCFSKTFQTPSLVKLFFFFSSFPSLSQTFVDFFFWKISRTCQEHSKYWLRRKCHTIRRRSWDLFNWLFSLRLPLISPIKCFNDIYFCRIWRKIILLLHIWMARRISVDCTNKRWNLKRFFGYLDFGAIDYSWILWFPLQNGRETWCAGSSSDCRRSCTGEHTREERRREDTSEFPLIVVCSFSYCIQ